MKKSTKIRVRQSQLINSLQEGYAKGLLKQVGWVTDLGNDGYRDISKTLTLGKDRAGCQGCAVGNIFAELLSSDTKMKSLSSHIEKTLTSETKNSNICSFEDCAPYYTGVEKGVVINLIEEKAYLTAISHVFEGTMSKTSSPKKALNACVKLIQTKFPKTITLNINGFTPKKKSRK